MTEYSRRKKSRKQSSREHLMSSIIAFARELVQTHTFTPAVQTCLGFMWACLIPRMSEKLKNIARLCYLSLSIGRWLINVIFFELRGSSAVCVVVRSRSAEWNCPSGYIYILFDSVIIFSHFFLHFIITDSEQSPYSRRFYLLLGIDKVSQRRVAWNHMYIVKSSCVNFIAGKKKSLSICIWFGEKEVSFVFRFLQIIFCLFRRGHTVHTPVACAKKYDPIPCRPVQTGSRCWLAKNYTKSMERPRSQIKAPMYGFIQSPIVCVRSPSKKSQHKRNRQRLTLRMKLSANSIWVCGFHVFVMCAHFDYNYKLQRPQLLSRTDVEK